MVEDGVSSLDDGEGCSLSVLVVGGTVGEAEVGDGSSLVVGGGASVVGDSLVGAGMVTDWKWLLVVVGGIA